MARLPYQHALLAAPSIRTGQEDGHSQISNPSIHARSLSLYLLSTSMLAAHRECICAADVYLSTGTRVYCRSREVSFRAAWPCDPNPCLTSNADLGRTIGIDTVATRQKLLLLCRGQPCVETSFAQSKEDTGGEPPRARHSHRLSSTHQ